MQVKVIDTTLYMYQGSEWVCEGDFNVKSHNYSTNYK